MELNDNINSYMPHKGILFFSHIKNAEHQALGGSAGWEHGHSCLIPGLGSFAAIFPFSLLPISYPFTVQ